MPVIEFNDYYSNYPHRFAKLIYFDNRGFTVGSWSDHAKTEILNFELDANGQVKGYWTDIEVNYPNVQYIYGYAALAIESTIYLFGGWSDGRDLNRVVLFENNKYTDIATINQKRDGHEVIQIGHLVYNVGGYG